MTWYEKGLRFTCTQCGKCCKGPEPGFVWVTPDEIAALAKRLDMTEDEFGRRYLRRIGITFSLVERANHDCIFWDDEKGCTVYEDRPSQCRTFPFWPEFVIDRDAWRKIDWCPGKDKGRHYTKAEIERLAAGDGATGEKPEARSQKPEAKDSHL